LTAAGKLIAARFAGSHFKIDNLLPGRLASDDWPLLLKVVSSAFASVSLFVDHSDLNARAQPTDKL
jgi:hypothetical protein